MSFCSSYIREMVVNGQRNIPRAPAVGGGLTLGLCISFSFFLTSCPVAPVMPNS